LFTKIRQVPVTTGLPLENFQLPCQALQIMATLPRSDFLNFIS
jgi:hypothetical protein